MIDSEPVRQWIWVVTDPDDLLLTLDPHPTSPPSSTYVTKYGLGHKAGQTLIIHFTDKVTPLTPLTDYNYALDYVPPALPPRPRPYMGSSDTWWLVYILRRLLCNVIGF